MKIEIDFDHKKLNRGFVNMTRACEIAHARTLSSMAALSRKNAIKKISDDFILRNNFTVKQLQFDKAEETWDINNQQSVFGATEKASYLDLQEKGGIKKAKSKYINIAQKNARGGSNRSLVQKSNYLKRIKNNAVRNTVLGSGKGTQKSRFVALAYKSFQLKKFMVTPDIFKVTSFTKSGIKPKFNKQLIYKANKQDVRIKATNWMRESIEKPIRDAQSIYNSQIGKLLKQKEII